MIVFNLNCSDCDLSFEGWFENTKDYNKQIKQGLVSCPSCNSTQIKKGLMAPNVAKKSNSKMQNFAAVISRVWLKNFIPELF